MRIALVTTVSSTDVTIATAVRLRKKLSPVGDLITHDQIRTRKVRNGRNSELQAWAVISAQQLFAATTAKHLTQAFRCGNDRRGMQPARLSGQSFDRPRHAHGSDDLA